MIAASESSMSIDDLVEQNQRLVYHVVSRMIQADELATQDSPDAISFGLEALWEAAKFYKPELGNTFSTYAVPAIERAIVRCLRRTRRRHAVHGGLAIDILSSGAVVECVEISRERSRQPMLIARRRDDGEEELRTAQAVNDLRTAINRLTEQEQTVIRLRFGLDGPKKSQGEIANSLGMSRDWVGNIERAAIARLRRRVRWE